MDFYLEKNYKILAIYLVKTKRQIFTMTGKFKQDSIASVVYAPT